MVQVDREDPVAGLQMQTGETCLYQQLEEVQRMTPWSLSVQFSPILFAEHLMSDGAVGGLAV